MADENEVQNNECGCNSGEPTCNCGEPTCSSGEPTCKAGSSAKAMFNDCLNSVKEKMAANSGCFCHSLFNFKGRASVGGFWLNTLIIAILLVVWSWLFFRIVSEVQSTFLYVVFSLIGGAGVVILLIGEAFNLIRRLHDLNLSGFWLLYLQPAGFFVAYMADLLGVDGTCTRVMEKFRGRCSNWFFWILFPIFWIVGSPLALLILLFAPGKNEPNDFGNP